MIVAYITALTIASWACLYPMLRMPRVFIAAPEVAFDVPAVTFDSRGFA